MRFAARVFTALLLLAAAMTPVAAQDYPNRRITIVVPHVAGAAVDALARLLGQRLSETWGQPVVIENRPGAGANLGAQAVARAAPDGYTLMFSTNGPLTTNAALYRAPGFDPEKDFDPLVLVSNSPVLVVASLALPVKSIAELIAHARKEPGKLSAGTGGHGTAAHFALAELKKAAGLDILHVPYRGAVPALADVASNTIQVVVGDPVAVQPFMLAGKVRVLAVSGAARLAGLPDIPTVAESGLPGFDVAAWLAITAPRGLPPEIAGKLAGAINAILKEPQFQKTFVDQGFDPVPAMQPAAVAAFVRRELPRWKQRVHDAGLEIQ